MSALTATLRDDFEDNVTAAAWSATTSGSATVAETSGQARFTLPSSTAGTHTARYTSAMTYDLTGGTFYVTIGTMVATGVAATAFFQLYIDGSNTLQWIQVSGTIYARSIVAGVSTDQYSAAWSGTTYKYLRISESGGTITWSSSTNGTSWTSRATLANPFAVTDLSIDFGATCSNIASPGSLRLDDVNLILPALTTNWRWTQIVWPLTNRYKVVTLALDTAGTAQGYVVTADGVDVNGDPSGNVRYWSGPASGGRLLTEQASDAAAKAMAVNIPVDGRFDLPTIIEARVIRVYHRSIDGSAYTLREVYPRRLVQADDIEADAIRALHIAAHQINADHLDVIDLDATAYITAGGGIVTLDDRGMTIIAPSSYLSNAAIRWTNSGGTTLGELYQLELVSGVRQMVLASRLGSQPSTLTLLAEGSGQAATIAMSGTSTTSTVNVSADMTTFQNDGDVTVSGGLNIGTATSAAAGAIRATVDDSATTTDASVLILGHNSSGTPAANFGTSVLLRAEDSTTADQNLALIVGRWATATHASRAAQLAFFVYDTAIRTALILEASGSAPKVGFLGATSVTRPNVTGTLTGATLAQTQTVVKNLLTALGAGSLGLVTDSTT